MVLVQTTNVFIGGYAGRGESGAENCSASENVIIGDLAGQYTCGSNNVFIGKDAGRELRTSSTNVIIGYDAGGADNNDTSNKTGDGKCKSLEHMQDVCLLADVLTFTWELVLLQVRQQEIVML